MKKLKDYLPDRLLSLPVAEFQDAFQPEIDKLAEAVFETAEYELFAKTADRWLPLWETAYGLPVDPQKPLSFRRSRLMSKLRGAGTTTAEMIRSVVSSYSNSACTVEEIPGEYRFEIRFTDVVGIPPNMEDVKATIEEIKPAHLAYGFVYLWHIWGDYASQTWGSLSGMVWGSLKGENQIESIDQLSV